MYNYTRKYYINDKETSFNTVLKYIEIMLEYGTPEQVRDLPIHIVDVMEKGV